MDRTTALSAAGALTMTSVATVTALFLTVDRAGEASPAPAATETVQYEVATVATEELGLPPEASGSTVYEVEYVTVPPETAPGGYDDHEYEDEDDDHDEYRDEDEHEDEDEDDD